MIHELLQHTCYSDPTHNFVHFCEFLKRRNCCNRLMRKWKCNKSRYAVSNTIWPLHALRLGKRNWTSGYIRTMRMIGRVIHAVYATWTDIGSLRVSVISFSSSFVFAFQLTATEGDRTDVKFELESHFVEKMKKENFTLMKLQEDALVKRQKVVQLKIKVMTVKNKAGWSTRRPQATFSFFFLLLFRCVIF